MRSRPIVLAAATVAVAAVLAACSGRPVHRTEHDKPAATAAATTGVPAGVDCQDPTLNWAVYPECAAVMQGPASKPHTWPSGLTVRAVSTQTLNPRLAGQLKPGQALVKLTLELGDTGTAPVAVPANTPLLWQLLYGPNWFEAEQDFGNTDPGTYEQLNSPVPTRVAPGQTSRVYDAWAVPADQVGTLAVRFDMGRTIAPYTFTGLAA